MKKILLRGILSLGLFATALTSTIQAAEIKAPLAEKEWTFLIFLNADNNLDHFGVGDVEEMEEIGSNDQFNLVVQLDRRNAKPCTRLFIKKGSHDLVEDMGECDMGSKDVFTEFVDWGVENYPAKKYAVVMWNHGSGWNKKKGNTIFKGISYDDESGNHITTAQMTEASKTIAEKLGRKLDILAFDACLMQMVEVSYAVRDYVDVMIASEHTEPGEGWAYNDSMKPIAADPSKGVEEVATIIVDTYDASYNGGSQGNSSTTQSWVKLSKIEALRDSLNSLATALTGNYVAETKAALLATQKFYYRSNVDLIHYLEVLEQKINENSDSRNAQILSLLADAKTKANEFVGHSASHGYSMKNAKGTAIYFPSRGYSFSNKYKKLDWAKDSSWDEMLQAYYDASGTQLRDLGL